MSENEMNQKLSESIEKAKIDVAKPYSKDDVVQIIRSVMESMEIEAPMAKLYDELDSLAQFIESTRNEITLTRPDEISTTHIPTATDELDAVVGATEEATGSIMDACEVIEEFAEKLEDPAKQEVLVNAITQIYEACSFQDITGQRITKVVSALKHIETKVTHILDALGTDLKKIEAEHGPTDQKDNENLLNGPQLSSGSGIDQDEIDNLLASFD